ncbi:MAG: NUDIX domain-containing protein [Candidatus Moraniibacteriota bacterium]|nr:MAG: NUDIX domain-containing protein [Candidatus Moranbacteria bacterium]
MQYFLAVKGIIRKDGKILVLKRSEKDDHKPGVWETVGGGMDKEESPQDALAREISEETGLVVSVGSPFNIFTFKKDTGEFKVGITFLCEYVSGEVVLSEEHAEYRWIEPREFSEMQSVPSLHREIARYAELQQKL